MSQPKRAAVQAFCCVAVSLFYTLFSWRSRLKHSVACAGYCGYQFGSFAGQLGDGAAILLGEARSLSCQPLELS